MIPFLDAAAIRGSVSMAELLDAVETAYRDVAAGRDRSPIRSRLTLGEGDLLLMPGLREGGNGATVKIVTVMAANASRGLPTVQATVIWLDGTTGEPRAILDGATLTAMRTGAASGVGTRLLARLDASTLAVLGAGNQAEWQVHAILAARSIRRVVVYSRSSERRAAFAARMAAATGLHVAAVDSAEAAVRDADVVCCATTSSEPVFEAEWLRPGAHVNGIGAYRLGMVEIPAAAFGRAALVTVDSLAAARKEAGDVMAAVTAGSIAEGSLVEIGSVGREWAHNRDPEAITVFKSVGLAVQDVAAAELVVARLLGESSAT
jgi:ornithine cyclodeaminase/alanine dehydrogenase-like protein (mu-crystallin family)